MLINQKIFDSRKYKRLTSSEALTLIALLIRADKNMACFPEYETIASDTRQSKRTISRAVLGLEKKKAVKVNRITGTTIVKGRNVIKTRNTYDLSVWSKYCQFNKRDNKTIANIEECKKLRISGQIGTSQHLSESNKDDENGIENIEDYSIDKL